MGRAVVLAAGALVYMWFLQFGHDIATLETSRLQLLYTSSQAQAAAISATSNPYSTTVNLPTTPSSK